uniref:VPS37B subunit of ESCRT-I n=1 Tax=Myotis myotis TaxID=51298 RepID=A0A7J7S3J3_MYOMY|nr:VPS37B subunit of ESCRT-I [Myotis myotis]
MAGAGGEARFAGLSLVQLNELLEDEGQLAAMVQRMEETQSVQLNKEMTLASNRSLAEGNLLYQPQLDARKACLTQKYQDALPHRLPLPWAQHRPRCTLPCPPAWASPRSLCRHTHHLSPRDPRPGCLTSQASSCSEGPSSIRPGRLAPACWPGPHLGGSEAQGPGASAVSTRLG